MLDFIKLSVPNRYAENLLNNKVLNFQEQINSGGELVTTQSGFIKKVAKFQNLVFKIFEKKPIYRIEISGSLQRFYQSGNNAGEFGFQDCIMAVNHLSTIFNIPLQDFNIHCVEFGVNMTTPIETRTILEGIKTCSGKKPERDTFNNNGLMIRFDFSQYQIKIYDKGSQYGYANNILRFELHIKKMDFLHSKGIQLTNLNEFNSVELFSKFIGLLQQYWNRLIVYPKEIQQTGQRLNSQKFMQDAWNPDYWATLHKSSSKKYNKHFNKFRMLQDKLEPENIHQFILNKISEYLQPVNLEMGKNDPLVYGQNIPTLMRYCKGCGKEITHQQNNSEFCTAKYAGEKAAHKCRNMVYNPKHNRKKKYQRIYGKGQLSIFPIYLHTGLH